MSAFTASCFTKCKISIFNCLRFYSSLECKKVCIIGSGPGGFYTAQHILKNCEAEVDIYEKLPVPFGLIRYGVAPDHPEIKVVTNAFTKVAQHERCNFFGNIDIGQDIRLSDLVEAYHAIVLAFGACKDKELGISGEEAQNVFSARRFVNWYNGHPDYVNENINLDTEVAAVIGHGNVALDVARILLKSTDELKTTDIAQHAMDSLMKSKVKKVVLIGRRGPLQVSFTIKELREMIRLNNCAVSMSLKDFDGIPELIQTLPRPKKRLVELLYNTAVDKEIKNVDRTLELKFFRSPKSILTDDQGKVKKIVLGINMVDGKSENAKVISMREEEEIECGLVLRSVGYQSQSIDTLIPFDSKKCIIPNERGRVIGQDGMYCSGWVKTGPTGVILSTMNGSYETAETILQDMKKEQWFQVPRIGKDVILNCLKKKGIKFTTFDDWMEIDKIELERGKTEGKSRQKICDVKEMLQTANVQ